MKDSISAPHAVNYSKKVLNPCYVEVFKLLPGIEHEPEQCNNCAQLMRLSVTIFMDEEREQQRKTPLPTFQHDKLCNRQSYKSEVRSRRNGN